MHDHVGFKRLVLPDCSRMHKKAVGLALNCHDLRVEANLNPELFVCLHQHRDQVGVKLLKRPAAAMQHPDLGAGTGGDVRELERDVAAPDDEDATQQALELQELCAGCQQVLSRELQDSAPCRSLDYHVA